MIEKLPFLEGLNLLPVDLLEYSRDAEKTGSKEYIKKTDGGKYNTDVEPLGMGLVEVVANWEITPNATDKENSAGSGELSDIDGNLANEVDRDGALDVGK